MIKKILLYTFIFLLAFVSFLSAMVPARIVWEEIVKPNVDLRRIGVSIVAVEGTLWQGRALVKYQNLANILDWDIDFSNLVSLTLPVSFELESEAGTANGKASLGISGTELRVSKAEVDLSRINSLIRRQRVTLAGDVFVKDLRVDLDGEKISAASGIASWSGGGIAYPVQRSVHEREMPPFQIKLETKPDGEIFASVRDSGGTMDVIEASLSPQGEALVTVKRRLLDLADEAWPQNSRETDTVFKVKKMIY